MRRILPLAWLALVAAQMVLGSVWLARNLAWVPDYGDTAEFVQIARTLEVDTYRGIAYPALLAGIGRVPGGAGVLRTTAGEPHESARTGVLLLKALQLVAGAAAIAYFLRVLVPPVGTRAGPRRLATGCAVLLWALVFLDPLVAHFDLAVMTDGLALAGSLAFVAALAAFALGRGSRFVSGAIVLVTLVVVASLRVEKLWVMGCSTLASLAAWLLLQRRLPAEERPLSARRATAVLALLAAGAAGVLALQRLTHAEDDSWPLADNLVHSRVVFPHLFEVYDELPEDVRARLTKRLAKKHDTNPVVGFRVINEITGRTGPRSRADREEAPNSNARPSVDRLRHTMLREMAAVVLHERGAALAADVVKDAVENTFASVSWYVRLAILARAGTVSPGDGTQKTYETLAAPHPRLSRAYVIASAAVFAASLVLALLALARRLRGGPPLGREVLLPWVPVAAFVLANACAFALRADVVHVRYVLLAHAAMLVLVLRGALEFLLGGSRPAGA